VPTDDNKTPPLPVVTDPSAKAKTLEELCQALIQRPDAETAKRIAFEAGELEAFYSMIRANAEQVAGSAAALASLRGLVPPEPPRIVPEGGNTARESVGRKIGGGELEESFQGLGLTGRFSGILPILGDVEKTSTSGQPPAGNPNEFDLGDFFSNVSRSVVDAQRELDIESMKYSREQVNSPVPPALYSIPTVHAEIKASLSSTDGAGILVKLIDDQSQSSYTESTISFDIVSSPPPPGALGKFTAGVPRFLAVEGDDHKRALDALGAISPPGPFAADGWQSRTLVFRDLDPALETAKHKALLALIFGPIPAPAKGQPTDYSGVPLYFYTLTDDQPPVAAPADRLTPAVVRVLSAIVTWLNSITVQ
jgi:hypothetical protein